MGFIADIVLLEYNLKAIFSKSNPYSRPGYEGLGSIKLTTHNLNELLEYDCKILDNVNAVHRIKPREESNMRVSRLNRPRALCYK